MKLNRNTPRKIPIGAKVRLPFNLKGVVEKCIQTDNKIFYSILITFNGKIVKKRILAKLGYKRARFEFDQRAIIIIG